MALTIQYFRTVQFMDEEQHSLVKAEMNSFADRFRQGCQEVVPCTQRATEWRTIWKRR
ncbi:hypothetical protein [Pedomonas mirosovicensis]|uniref:hypothetical protein n=1 Tax=Pedomonas mirosovicensis TaxID=2908641 RepID=UPI00216715BA|nr:hypothetical protein [Pedomonas mirosovicensis]MCH8686691.1 hypothetical protein [Pedomonas mirosovicensis]